MLCIEEGEGPEEGCVCNAQAPACAGGSGFTCLVAGFCFGDVGQALAGFSGRAVGQVVAGFSRSAVRVASGKAPLK